MTKEGTPIPITESTEEVFVRTVDDQPAIVLVERDGRRIVVPVALRPVEQQGQAA